MSDAELRELARLKGDDVPLLAAAAHRVRLHYCGSGVGLEGILSAKTGGCPEDCQFCSQSVASSQPIGAIDLMPVPEVVRAAEETASLGALEFCIVLATRGPSRRTMRWLHQVVPEVKARTGLQVAVSAGILDDHLAGEMAQIGVHRYNHNLETARSFFPRVVTTHTYDERYETCRLVKEHGMELCSGVLLGMGESDEQRIELLADLRRLDPTEVPVNFLNPRPGTGMANRPRLAALEALKWLAIARLALPHAVLRLAGGREITLAGLLALGLTGGANALILGNYLTTLGRNPDDDLALIAQLGMSSRRSEGTGALEVPRRCPSCGARIAVQVRPTGFQTTCQRCHRSVSGSVKPDVPILAADRMQK